MEEGNTLAKLYLFFQNGTVEPLYMATLGTEGSGRSGRCREVLIKSVYGFFVRWDEKRGR